MNDAQFKRIVRGYWRRHGRHDLPWRKTIDPYAILVSEVMLQQTQVPRVMQKYQEFLRVFPSFRVLAQVPRAKLLSVWQGLGYNRRALMLQRCAQAVMREHRGVLPADYETLRKFPGIGPYTAGAVLAFAFNLPHPVIETNIRRIYLHHFFPRRRNVPDSAILPIVARHVSAATSPRDWYSALMDYGTYLAGRIPNPNRRSRHHVRQETFEGSVRQLRGRIMRRMLADGASSLAILRRACGSDPRTAAVVAALVSEGFLLRSGSLLKCA